MPYKNPADRVANAAKWNREHKERHAEHAAKQELRPEVKQRRKEFYEKTKNAVWRRYSHFKSSAKRLSRDFTISQDEYAALVADNSCHYCGGHLPEAGYGIDRQDSRIGYVHGNVVPCCERCNEKKGSLEGLGFKYPRTVELLTELIRK